MGVMRFLVEPEELLENWPELFRAYISGPDGRVFPSRIEIDGNIVACRRHVSDSGKFYVAFPVAGRGRPVIHTSSLPERERPYLLVVELARGKIGELRDQVSAWELSGMKILDAFWPLYRQAHHLFTKAVLQQEDEIESSRQASAALKLACEAAEMLTKSYTRLRLAVRRQKSPTLPAALGCNFAGVAPQPDWGSFYKQAFTAAMVPIEWRNIEPNEGEYHWDLNDAQVEWCQNHRTLMCGGPLLNLSPGGVPEWLKDWEQDYFNLMSFVSDFVETAISRYAGRIRLWEISAGGNIGGGLALSEENRLNLVARTLDVARHVDEENQLLIRVDQPWGGYQIRGQHRLSPMQFVDALIRSGVGVTAVNLEFAIGYTPGGTASRDLLSFSQLLDLWSLLPIPLFVTLAFPSSGQPDPLANPDLKVDEQQQWNAPWSEEAQADWIDAYLPLVMSKQQVVGIFWSHLSDGAVHRFPHAGLIGSDNRPKPALERIKKYRQMYWRTPGNQ